MAVNKKDSAADSKQNAEQVEQLFQKYVKSTLRTLGSTQFYQSFMDAMAQAQNEIQFSNRRMEKIVDTEWIDAIEEVLSGFQNIIENPRNVIREDELIVNVANAKKTGSDVVRHLATHASLIEDFNEDSGDVRPNKVMQKYREDSIGQVYENRVVFTTLEMAYQFVKIRHDALLEAMSEEFGAKLKFKTDMTSATESVHMDMFLHIRDIDGALDTDDKNRDVFNRISRLYRILSNDMNSHFARHMSRYPRVKGAVTKTNVLKRNKNYRAIIDLLEYLRGYDSIGYTIKVIEQNPAVDEAFEQDIFRNTLFQYLLLKNHLERDKDRRLPAPLKEKKRTLKPKFIKEIIEELTEDYDLPDVEIRKVLIEELTREQLMPQEAVERRRLVEEQEERKRQEKERLRLEKEKEKERLRLEREAEKERIRLEREAEKQRQLVERMEREQEDRRRSNLFKKEISRFKKDLDERLEQRNAAALQEEIVSKDFEDAAYILEETERRKKEEANRKRQLRRQELEQKRIEELEAQQRALAEEQARREELLRQQLEKEALLRQQQKEQEEKLRLERERLDNEAVARFLQEIDIFRKNVPINLLMREQKELEAQQQKARLDEEKKLRQQAKNSDKRRHWRLGK
ncbi:MAG: hypothetical protein IJY33_03100 [Oscillospiraceae bacterium]|nr:hypothetical protein [Oscillospiraceae bacterium]